MKHRSPKLTPEKIDLIVDLIRSWKGDISWDLLIESAEQKLHSKYSRQALYKHASIYVAYDSYRKSGLANSDNKFRPMSATLKASTDRIKRLELELVELKKRESLLIEKFVIWAYNASIKGLTEEYLNRPLPPTNRNGHK